MDIRELRIGNYIEFKKIPNEFGVKKGVNFVDENLFSNILMFKTLKQKSLPIPLTEEWLLKFGNSKVYQEWDIGTETFELREDGLYFSGGEGILFGKPIKYVHQLQNLYFALTGEELIF